MQQLISKGKSYEAVCVSPWRVGPSGIKGQNRRDADGGATLRPAVRHNGRHEKSRDNVISICSRFCGAMAGIESSSNRVKRRERGGVLLLCRTTSESFVREEKCAFSYPSLLPPPSQPAVQSDDRFDHRIDRIESETKVASTMAPTISPRLSAAMKGIWHKAEVWLSRENQTSARNPFRSRRAF